MGIFKEETMRNLLIVTKPLSLDLLQGKGVYLQESAINIQLNIPTISFKNAKTLLGKTLDFAIYDMRHQKGVCFNLDAFAIVAGTIANNGYLIVICPKWSNLVEQIDYDSRRWSEQQEIKTPQFFIHFQKLIHQFQFKVVDEFNLNQLINKNNRCDQFSSKLCKILKLTTQQQAIFDKLPQDSTDVHLITAPRGRGKSVLLGQLAQFIQQNYQMIITARSHSVLPSFWKNVEKNKVLFYSPDQLIQEIENKQISDDYWLFIDEAATLPLPMLHQLVNSFKKVILATTTQNYEGTGRGFELKFLPQLKRTYKQWQLTEPLRWQNNDLLEDFINQLLILEQNKNNDSSSDQVFYQLLANAHYKTTPTDLRRLFDAPNQYFLKHIENKQLIGGIWGIFEGSLDKNLAEHIWKGERRPKGSLVAQYLCFQGNLIEACLLRSLRISRIAVISKRQGQGIGKHLVSELILQIKAQKECDFISVSFGLNENLFYFWQSCGFKLVQISPTKEASSGYHSAMMLYPLTKKGKTLTVKAQTQFQRDFSLLPFLQHLQKIVKISPIKNKWEFTEQDYRNLDGFANYHRSLTACYASLKRLQKYNPKFDQLNDILNTEQLQLPNYKKEWLVMARKEVKKQLYTHFI